MYSLEYLPSYNDDLDAILFHLAVTQKSRWAAENLLEALDKAVLGLREFPRRYRRHLTAWPLDTEYRAMGVKGNTVFYTVNDEEQLIQIHRILNSHSDFDQRLT